MMPPLLDSKMAADISRGRTSTRRTFLPYLPPSLLNLLLLLLLALLPSISHAAYHMSLQKNGGMRINTARMRFPPIALVSTSSSLSPSSIPCFQRQQERPLSIVQPPRPTPAPYSINNSRAAAVSSRNGDFSLGSWTNRILALNVIMYGLQHYSPLPVTAFGVKIDDLISRGQYHRLFTPMLLHANFAHLFTNSYSMLSVGEAVETYFGARPFLALYVISGFCGNALSYVSKTAPVALGASTAVAGLMGALGLFAYRHRAHPQLASAYKSIVHVVLLNAAMGATNSRIDNMGHLGGFLGGVACAYLFGPRFVVVRDPSSGRMYYHNYTILQQVVGRIRIALHKAGLVRIERLDNLPTSSSSSFRSREPRRGSGGLPPPPSSSSSRSGGQKRGFFQKVKSMLGMRGGSSSSSSPSPSPGRRDGRGRGGRAAMILPPRSSSPFSSRTARVYTGLQLRSGPGLPRPFIHSASIPLW